MKKSDGTLYWVDDNFHPLSIGTASGLTKDFIFMGDRRTAFVSIASGNPYYYLPDQLGSTAVIASGDGKSIQWDADYYPFGNQRKVFTSAVNNAYQFTGYEYDSDTQYDYAVARFEAGKWGRFLSPDPYMGSMEITNPQSLNRYAYALGSPLKFTDPRGLKNIINYSWFLGAMSVFGGGADGCTMDGIDTPCGIVTGAIQGGGAAQCTNNDCGIGTADPFTCLGDACGYMTIQYANSHMYECNGKPCTLAEWNQMVKPYTDMMKGILASLLGVDPAQLTYDHMNGGNANFLISVGTETAFTENNDCSAYGSQTRCNGDEGSLHFLPVYDDNHELTGYFAHLDSADPFTSISGFFEHTWIDVILGHAIFDTGVPH